MIIKVCKCCDMQYTMATWAELDFCGLAGDAFDEAGKKWVLELRHCGCGSTLAIDVEVK